MDCSTCITLSIVILSHLLPHFLVLSQLLAYFFIQYFLKLSHTFSTISILFQLLSQAFLTFSTLARIVPYTLYIVMLYNEILEYS